MPCGKSQRSIGLEDLLCRVYKRWSALLDKVYRCAAEFALQDANLTAKQKKTLTAFAYEQGTLESLAQDEALYSIVQRFRRKAEEQVRRGEALRVGYHRHKKTAWQIVAERFFEAAGQCVSGFCVRPITGESGCEWKFEGYCRRLEAGETRPDEEMERAVVTLDADGFGDALLAVLWSECREEAVVMDLPNPNPPKIVSTAKALALFKTSRNTIRKYVADGTLTDHRKPGAPYNSPFQLDEAELDRLFIRLPTR